MRASGRRVALHPPIAELGRGVKHETDLLQLPHDQRSYSTDNEWLFGDSLLAVPVLANVRSRRIHVPTGQWYDVRNRCVVSGQTTLRNYPVTLPDVPMFVKLGTPETEMLLRALVRGERVDGGTQHC